MEAAMMRSSNATDSVTSQVGTHLLDKVFTAGDDFDTTYQSEINMQIADHFTMDQAHALQNVRTEAPPLVTYDPALLWQPYHSPTTIGVYQKSPNDGIMSGNLKDPDEGQTLVSGSAMESESADMPNLVSGPHNPS